jgi:hypothetical protein
MAVEPERLKGELSLAQVKIVGENIENGVNLLQRRINTIPAATGTAAQRREAELRLGDAVLDALIEARSERIRDWAIRYREGLLNGATWDEIKTNIMSELVPPQSASRQDIGDGLVFMARERTETVSAYVARFMKQAQALGTDFQNMGVSEFVVLRQTLKKGLEDDELVKRMTRGISLGTAESWDEFTSLLRVEAASAWTTPPPVAREVRKAQESRKTKPPGTPTGLTAAERKERMAKGLCFLCGERGLSRDCPNHGAARPSGNGGAGGGH